MQQQIRTQAPRTACSFILQLTVTRSSSLCGGCGVREQIFRPGVSPLCRDQGGFLSCWFLDFSQSYQIARSGGTTRTIWSNLLWQNHGLDKMAQHPVQPNPKCPMLGALLLPWGDFPTRTINHWHKNFLVHPWNFLRSHLCPLSLVFSVSLLVKRESSSSL